MIWFGIPGINWCGNSCVSRFNYLRLRIWIFVFNLFIINDLCYAKKKLIELREYAVKPECPKFLLIHSIISPFPQFPYSYMFHPKISIFFTPQAGLVCSDGWILNEWICFIFISLVFVGAGRMDWCDAGFSSCSSPAVFIPKNILFMSFIYKQLRIFFQIKVN
jgi:hypothetical protein